jgi:hypothetical protein
MILWRICCLLRNGFQNTRYIIKQCDGYGVCYATASKIHVTSLKQCDGYGSNTLQYIHIIRKKWISYESEEDSPNSDPHTRGIISSMAEQGASSKHSCRASRQLRIATAVLTLGPETTTYFRIWLITDHYTQHIKTFNKFCQLKRSQFSIIEHTQPLLHWVTLHKHAIYILWLAIHPSIHPSIHSCCSHLEHRTYVNRFHFTSVS